MGLSARCWSAADEERHKLTAEDSELRRATEETRANLSALEKNTARRRSARQAHRAAGGDAARLDGIGKRIIEVDLVMNEQRVRFNEAIRA